MRKLSGKYGLSARVAALSKRRSVAMGVRLARDKSLPRLVRFLETHHENEDREHEGCQACVLINRIELELGG